MTIAINFLVLMTLLFAGLAQTHALAPALSYEIAGGCAVFAFSLAVARYAGRKKRGE